MSKSELKAAWDLYFEDVFKMAYVLTQDENKSLEITIDVFKSFVKIGENLHGGNNIKCFLTTTARNYSIDALKFEICPI